MRSGDVSVMFITEEYTQGRIKTRDENSREIEGGKGAKSGAEIPLKRIEGKPLEEGKRVNGSMGQRVNGSTRIGFGFIRRVPVDWELEVVCWR